MQRINYTHEEPTQQLRWIKRKVESNAMAPVVLQQLWAIKTVNSDGDMLVPMVEWRDVPEALEE